MISCSTSVRSSRNASGTYIGGHSHSRRRARSAGLLHRASTKQQRRHLPQIAPPHGVHVCPLARLKRMPNLRGIEHLVQLLPAGEEGVLLAAPNPEERELVI